MNHDYITSMTDNITTMTDVLFSYLEQLRAHVDGCSYCEATCRVPPQAEAPGAGVSLLQIAAALKTSCTQAFFVYSMTSHAEAFWAPERSGR